MYVLSTLQILIHLIFIAALFILLIGRLYSFTDEKNKAHRCNNWHKVTQLENGNAKFKPRQSDSTALTHSILRSTSPLMRLLKERVINEFSTHRMQSASPCPPHPPHSQPPTCLVFLTISRMPMGKSKDCLPEARQ